MKPGFSSKQDKKAKKVIRKAVIAAAIAGITSPFPGGIDIPVLVAIWLGMLKLIADIYNHTYNQQSLKAQLKDALMASGILLAGIKTLAALLALTGLGLIGAMGLNATLNGIVTWRVGHLFMDTWKSDREVTFKDLLWEFRRAISKKELFLILRIIRLIVLGKG